MLIFVPSLSAFEQSPVPLPGCDVSTRTQQLHEYIPPLSTRIGSLAKPPEHLSPWPLFAETVESESRQQSAAQADRFCTHGNAIGVDGSQRGSCESIGALLVKLQSIDVSGQSWQPLASGVGTDQQAEP